MPDVRATRNGPCPCGSGSKTKKCHPEYVGKSAAGIVGMEAREAWAAEMSSFIEGVDGYEPPMSDEERRTFVKTGCPFGCVFFGSEPTGPCAAPNCGV